MTDEGSHKIKVYAMDKSGNSAVLSFTITVDNIYIQTMEYKGLTGYRGQKSTIMHSGYSLRQRRHLRYRFKELCVLQIIAQHPFSFNFVMCLLSYLAAGIFFNAAFMEPGEATYLLIAGIVAAVHRGMSGHVFADKIINDCLSEHIANVVGDMLDFQSFT